MIEYKLNVWKQMEWLMHKWNDKLNMNGFDKYEINK